VERSYKNLLRKIVCILLVINHPVDKVENPSGELVVKLTAGV
jgi:hypothetical protein